MKNQILLLVALFICTATFAQKDELKAAEKAVKKNDYDAVLMDVQMPEMNGYEATEAIRLGEEQSDAARLPIIAMTANAMDADRKACREAGMDEFIAKPVRAKELMRVLEQFSSPRE